MKLRKNLLAQEGDTSDEELQLAISTRSDRGEGSQEKNGLFRIKPYGMFCDTCIPLNRAVA